MAEPFNLLKAIDLSPASLGKSVSVFIKGALVIALVAGLCLGVWIIVKPHFTKPLPTTGISGDVGTLNQDCSEQVCKAIKDWENSNKKTQPWITLRAWKLFSINLGGT